MDGILFPLHVHAVLLSLYQYFQLFQVATADYVLSLHWSLTFVVKIGLMTAARGLMPLLARVDIASLQLGMSGGSGTLGQTEWALHVL